MLCSFGLSANQPAVLFSHTKSAPATSQSAVLFSHNKSAPAISHSQANTANTKNGQHKRCLCHLIIFIIIAHSEVIKLLHLRFWFLRPGYCVKVQKGGSKNHCLGKSTESKSWGCYTEVGGIVCDPHVQLLNVPIFSFIFFMAITN